MAQKSWEEEEKGHARNSENWSDQDDEIILWNFQKGRE